MRKEDRDWFLTEAIGECTHNFVEVAHGYRTTTYMCDKCHFEVVINDDTQLMITEMWKYVNNFSTWNGFGKLFEFSKKQIWWREFKEIIIENGMISEDIINPDKFANRIYEFLNTRSTK